MAICRQVSWNFPTARLWRIGCAGTDYEPCIGSRSLLASPLCTSARKPETIARMKDVAHLLLRCARGEPVERPPVWAMRQAGRWDPEFNRLRAGLSFYEFSENAELAAQASLLPRRFEVDAIILFYDITTLTVAMGLAFVLRPSEGPVPERPVRTEADVARLAAEPDPARIQHI